MPTSVRPAALVIVATLTILPAGERALGAMPSEDPELMPSLVCVERVSLPPIENALEAKWSADSRRLAVSWSLRVPSTRTVTGYEEQEHTDLLDLRTGARSPLGIGDGPRWSATGRYLSYWGPDADELLVVKDLRIVARLTPTVPDVRWVGDGLLFIERAEIREWRDDAVRTVAHLEERYVPRYPRDDLYFSADGEHFTLTRYSQDGAVERAIGTTRSGLVEPLDLGDASYIEWSPSGSEVLVRHRDRIELREIGGAVRSVPFDRAAVHAWAPDGETLLLGRVSPTVPGGDAFDRFRAYRRDGLADDGASAILPNVLGERRFSPDGRFFVGASRTGPQTTRLEVYRCRGAPDRPRDTGDATARRAAIDGAPTRLLRPAAGEVTQFVQGTHTGIDVAAPFGSLVTADGDGSVTSVGWVDVGGNRVCVQHGGGLESCFYHTSLAFVAVGDRVVRGQPVALIGMTGVTTGPHTHWEVKRAGRVVDPLTYRE